ncbi:MAG: hypothetical protein NT004_04665 [Bacteroidetes bacterium]|nr:hypothetical protein [Bacteroidota bacterium]
MESRKDTGKPRLLHLSGGNATLKRYFSLAEKTGYGVFSIDKDTVSGKVNGGEK